MIGSLLFDQPELGYLNGRDKINCKFNNFSSEEHLGFPCINTSLGIKE